MWHTSCGDRTLQGAEARLFATALLCLLDEAGNGQFEDYDLEVPCFDHLTYGQKIAVLAAVGHGLLREDVPVVPLTAVLESGIAAVFEHLRGHAGFEIETNSRTYWRRMIVAARRETGAEEVPEPACTDPDEWDFQIQELSDRILWDADYEDEALYLDRAPEEARELRRTMGIEERYFEAVAEDLTDRQVADRIAELRRQYDALVEEVDDQEERASEGEGEGQSLF